MAFLRKKRIGNGTYYYIVQNRRRGGKTMQRICEYLGRDPSKARLAAAIKYWEVGAKKRGGTANR